MLHPTATEHAADFWSDRQLHQFNDATDPLEAAREQGAESAVKEVIQCVRRAAELCPSELGEARARIFIATLCGALQPAFYDVAVEIAKGAGMVKNLYPDEV
ncbi:protein of unknown function [Burkholderia multivorans]